MGDPIYSQGSCGLCGKLVACDPCVYVCPPWVHPRAAGAPYAYVFRFFPGGRWKVDVDVSENKCEICQCVSPARAGRGRAGGVEAFYRGLLVYAFLYRFPDLIMPVRPAFLGTEDGRGGWAEC